MENYNQNDAALNSAISLNGDVPKALEFEKIILGFLLVSEYVTSDVIFILGDDETVFYEPKHQVIYKTILSLANSNKPINLQTVIINEKVLFYNKLV